jgi:hypothetical protein
MSLKNRKVNSDTKKRGLILAAGVLSVQPMLAGNVLVNQTPPVATAPQVVQDDAINNPMNVFIPAGVVNPDSAGLFQYGPVTLHPHVSYSFQYATGVLSAPGSQHDLISQSVSPGLTANLGRHWTIDYTPTLNFYSSSQFGQSVDHSLSLNGATHYEDWDFGLSQSFSSSSDPNTETAAQTSQQSYGTTLSAAYAFNDKWVGNASLNQNISLVSGFQNSYAWSTQEGATYVFSPRLNAGLSVGGGYTTVSDSGTNSNPDSVNEVIQVNGAWRATDKISLQGSVGFNEEQFLAAGYDDSLSPIFGAAVQYQPFLVTQISLSANRTTGASDYFVEAQSSDITTVNLNLSQRILVKYRLNLGIGYSRTEYTTTLSTKSVSLGNARTDNGYTFSAGFGRSFLKHGNWLVTYAYNDNESSDTGYSQHSNQIGFQLGFNY